MRPSRAAAFTSMKVAKRRGAAETEGEGDRGSGGARAAVMGGEISPPTVLAVSVSAVSAVVNRNITHPDNCRGGGGGCCGSDGGGDDDEMSSNPL